uniref:PPC domain-containing DNA-binding protein n=1 Tax=Synechococcus sp. CS-1329 TaxID=2847975 RepID=UPI00223AA493|nr:PPC domain-containing DNA-binding protein [Synechococcus sp. CS-1329]
MTGFRDWRICRMKVTPLRLTPGEDLRLALESWMTQQSEQAGCLISGIGSLSVAQLRLAGREESTILRGELEILSLAGTLGADGAHLQIAIADSSGSVIGGHLCLGSLVRTNPLRSLINPRLHQLEAAATVVPPAETPARPPRR